MIKNNLPVLRGVQGTKSSALASLYIAKPSTYNVPSSRLSTLSLFTTIFHLSIMSLYYFLNSKNRQYLDDG